ncbi:SMP-30/gluconolactonase/LRE family protein [Nibrella saemangeumensis]|uniref:SMP-30/gluconolactonase/LRE family protein n=1 Tax=Nibrella saemangeumensis TaxID=1084526 RepID=A0ABP8NIB9_9BACT
MKMKYTLFLAGVLCLFGSTISPVVAQQQQLIGQFDGRADVGPVKRPGTATYNASTQEYTLTSLSSGPDEVSMVWKKMTGDFILRTNVQGIGMGAGLHRRLGWMVRSGLEPGASQVSAAVQDNGVTAMQFRRTTGGQTEEKRSSVTGADVIQLARKGNTYTMSVARNGDTFVSEEVTDLALGDEVYVGLFVGSAKKGTMDKGVFHNVRIVVPARDNFVPYREYIGSNLEIMDVASGRRKIIYQSPESLQAPNWTLDDKALIYNSKGLLYRFDLASLVPTVIKTGFVTNNNNDHVLSFDGKMLGLSHGSKEDGNKSIIYTVPVTGGVPKKITPIGHSYLHGWSPDGQWLTFTGERNGEFDIYKVSSAGGPEVRLTTAKALDDGPEYSPDGQYIYFNSTRTGNMQIWRMKADGSEQEQVTTDAFNNWFPHISPDGKQLVILSFQKDINPNDHPFYKYVYLRLMPIVNGKPDVSKLKVIAYVYGGQGTINTPSWSPDSKRIAFISNTNSITTAAAVK